MTKGSASWADEMMSTYERDRDANIARNKAMLASLGIDKSVKKTAVGRPRKQVLEPRRRSSRVDIVTEVRARILQCMEDDEMRIEHEQRQLVKKLRQHKRNERRELSQMQLEENAQLRMAKRILEKQKRLAREQRAAAKLELKQLQHKKTRLRKMADERQRNVVVLKIPNDLKRLVAASRDWASDIKTTQISSTIQEDYISSSDDHVDSSSESDDGSSEALSSESSVDEASENELNKLSEDAEEDSDDDDAAYRKHSNTSMVQSSRLVVRLKGSTITGRTVLARRSQIKLLPQTQRDVKNQLHDNSSRNLRLVARLNHPCKSPEPWRRDVPPHPSGSDDNRMTAVPDVASRPCLVTIRPAEACGKISIGDELIAVDGALIGGPAGFKQFIPLLKSGLSVSLRFCRSSS
ncbi:hypothetical protein DYB32_001194 [Aphanomyces invadans]|uniref:PDZ domain-containing protein n=1 Tax=Aphanomyces invadans TaxID=157072 RepID=A0A418B781_9STRA|nr:hypothetical protein DYB32_001194 [Aphanomyces invadans]